MAEPLAIATTIISLYSTLSALKRYKDSYANAPDIVKSLTRECDTTLLILTHTKSRLENDKTDNNPSDPENPLSPNIEAALQTYITALYPEVEALKQELWKLLRPPETNYHKFKAKLLTPYHVSRFKEIQTKINRDREHFNYLLRFEDG